MKKIAVTLNEGGTIEHEATKIHVTKEGVLALMTGVDHVVAVYAAGTWAKAVER